MARQLQALGFDAAAFQGGYNALALAARILETTTDDVRARLQQRGCSTIVGPDGNEYLALDDFYALILRSTLNGRGP